MPEFFKFARSRFGLERRKALDALLLGVYFVGVFALTPLLKPGLFWGHIVFFVIPGAYLIVRYWQINSRILAFGLVSGTSTGTVLQVAAELNSTWTYTPIFDSLRFNGLPVEALAWYVIWIGFVTSVYSVFFDRHHPRRDSFCRHHWRFLSLGATIFALTVAFLLAYPQVFIIKHSYLVFGGIIVFVPIVSIFYMHPRIFGEVFKAAMFLSIFGLMYEVVGLQVGWWEYPSQYIATLTLLGQAIPIEELLLWVSLGSLVVLAGYEEIELC